MTQKISEIQKAREKLSETLSPLLSDLWKHIEKKEELINTLLEVMGGKIKFTSQSRLGKVQVIIKRLREEKDQDA